ncbi:hypothetical protein SRABI96_04905 [Peribacillus sp. Bi96]|nr:hypothetical protein SRABI96_04905 [Peribacillus sp. Bi96]
MNCGKAKKKHYEELDNIFNPIVSLFYVVSNHFLFYIYDLGISEFVYGR